MLLTEKSREEEKLSFKEQILRDLERVKEQDRKEKEVDIPNLTASSSQASSVTPANPESDASTEELMADSLSVVDKILKNAPSVPPLSSAEADKTDEKEEKEIRQPVIDKIEVVESEEPLVEPIHPAEESVVESVQPKVEPVELEPEEKEFNDTPTKIDVTYKTEEANTSIPSSENKAEALASTKAEALASTGSSDRLTEESRRDRRRKGKKPTKKKKKSKAKGFLVTFLVLLVLVAAGGYFGYGYVQNSLKPVDASSKEYMTVQIPEGSNVQQIGSTLEKSGLVKHGLIFSIYAKYKGSDLKSGYYNLKKSMSTDDLIQELQKGGTPEPQEPVLANLTIPEGYTLEQIAQTVGQLQGDFKEPLTADAFLAKAQDETFLSQLVAKYPNLLGSLPTKDSGVRYRLEGYLFPATYTIKDSTTVESLIDDMLAAMDKAMSPYYTTIKEKNLTVNELLSIASLVEKEGAKTEDRKLIAGVFYNRLNLGMPLQSNIAILYAEGKLGQKISLADDTAIDTTIDSPYNVYTHLGLMPGPVDSPSLDAIEASVNQTKSEYLYFVANVEDGKVYFATTKEEHDQNVAEHINSKLPQASSSN
ncbi:endolytic transglycosylase MltG [Streptococcus oralis]|uniref:Endolytic murein transglycosylase n=1 Tax=Streptococcus oralis subsp. tigurinus TaxID=1077464 RepID=A0AAX0N5M8_STROR|nr:endolytic transglycosylase MltG [Streptococcus oralis]MBS3688820.1 endolytic transglycosylase MltG [Streptococcus oralis]MCY7105733.1 endolytic transglycosylase MltG [Streptococcus oralis]ORO33070.1 aminodeoxychorismate lyase [Streptococcus oralis subsp. tigurinus]